MAKKALIKASIIVAILVAIFLPGFSRIQELRARNKWLEEQVLSLKLENQKLLEERERLEDDLDYIEKKARQKMGLVKEGEIIYRIVPEGSKK